MKLILLAAFCLVLGAGFGQAQSDKSTSLDAKQLEKMMKELGELQKNLAQIRYKHNSAALVTAQQHAGDAVQAYHYFLECLKKVRFTEEGKRNEAWREYTDRFGQEMKDEEKITAFREARWLQLRYLILTIQVAQMADRREALLPLTRFLDELVKLDGAGYEFIDEPVNDCAYAQALNVDKTLDPGEWELVPTNIEGIYDRILMPSLRAKKDPRLITAWNSKIRHLTAFAEQRKKAAEKAARVAASADNRQNTPRGGSTRDPKRSAEAKEERNPYEEFMTEKLPTMKWTMCEDLLKCGFEGEALVGMLDVVRSHPAHPETLKWMSQLQGSLRKKLDDLLGKTNESEPAKSPE